MDQHDRDMNAGWGRFAAMIATSAALMFFLMYQLVYQLGHATFSLNRMMASLIMAAVMTVVMLGYMWSMYRGAATKVAVVGGAIVIGAVLLYLNRTQQLVGDAAFMRAMIPHHSIAINNSRKAQISDPRVRQLADQIIASQVREIREMELLLDDIERNGERGDSVLSAGPAELTPEMEAQAREVLR